MKKNAGKNKATKRKKNTKGLVLLCLFLLALSGTALYGLHESRVELLEECEMNLLSEVQSSATRVSKLIESKFEALETIQDMVGISYGFGPEAVKVLDTSKKHYQMDFLGIVDKNYIYYDNDGDVIPNMRTENLERAMQGERVVVRSSDEISGEGVIFLVPCYMDNEVVGVIYAKYAGESLVKELSIESEEGTELVVDVSGTVILASEDARKYIGGISWDEFHRNRNAWEQKQQFDEEITLKSCAVASLTVRSGKDIYLTVAKVENFDGFYVVRLTGSDIVEKEIEDELFRIYVLMALMAFCIVGIVCFAVISFSKNRKEVYQAAYVDELTGLPSKAKHKMDAQELLDAQEVSYAYVTFDVDNFKYINEMFDYEYGNQLLIHIGKVIKNFTKKSELYARISADNFAMLWEDTGTKQELTERIRDMFVQIIEYREPEETLNVCDMKFSCGVYRVDGVKDINTIRANANLARTECKKRVLEDIVFYDEELKNRRVEEKELEYEAKEALGNNEFVVYFQPKYEVSTEQIIGAEALVRWNHPVRGVLSPGSFIPVFEFNGFIVDLDLYVLGQVCELISAWLKVGITPVCISVNLSRVHLHEHDLVDQLLAVVNRYNVPPEYIEFELTESAFYEETESLLRVMSDIKKAGFRLSMDDFGSGYSSLNLLRRLPVDVLKLDKVFLEDCDEADDETRGKRIVMHVISMAKDLKMEVLAEGVETKDQKEFLQEARCDMIQGYYFARPMPLKEFELLYRGQSCSQGSAHQFMMEEEIQNVSENRDQGEE